MPILPKINAGEGNLRVISAAVWRVLVAANDPPKIFRNGDRLVWIEQDDQCSPVMREVTYPRLKHHLTQIAHFYKVVKRQERNARPPDDLPTDLLARPNKADLPRLRRVVECPLFGPDGQLHLGVGYNVATEMYHSLHRLDGLLSVDPKPEACEIELARDLLLSYMLGDFPFTGPAEKAHAVAAILQPFVRLMIKGPTPLYLIEKPTPGTGGSLLAHAIAYLSLGRFPAGVTQPRTESEWRYSLLSWLRDGPSCILIDNLTGRLESAALASAITDITFRERIIGTSDAVTLPVDCLWIATGNNPALSSELLRRTARIRLDAGVEYPDSGRRFLHPDLRRSIMESRPVLIWACLMLCQAWIAAGQPAGKVTVGGFESWSAVIGGILQVAEIEGFLTNREEARRLTATETPNMKAFILSWWEKFRDLRVGVAELITFSQDLDLGGGTENGRRIRLGKLLHSLRDRRFGNLVVKSVGQNQNSQRYHLQRVSNETPNETGGPIELGESSGS